MKLSTIIVCCSTTIAATQFKGLSAWSPNPFILKKNRLAPDSCVVLMASRSKQKKVSRGQWAEARGFTITSTGTSTAEGMDDFCTVSVTICFS